MFIKHIQLNFSQLIFQILFSDDVVKLLPNSPVYGMEKSFAYIQEILCYVEALKNYSKVMGRTRCDDYSDAVQKRITDMAPDLGKDLALFLLGQLLHTAMNHSHVPRRNTCFNVLIKKNYVMLGGVHLTTELLTSTSTQNMPIPPANPCHW